VKARIITPLLAVLLLGAGVPAAAQQSDEAALIGGAVSHMVQLLRRGGELPAGVIRFDPRVVVDREIENPAYPGGRALGHALAEARRPEHAAAARSAMGAEPGAIDGARVCATESLRTCTLRDAVAVFAAGNPTVRGDSAEVVVKGIWLTDSAKQPVHDGVFSVTLVRTAEGWRPVASRTLNIS
jgi:hypothetical protein